MQIIYKRLDEIKPYPNNPRANDNAVEPVVRSIQEFGFKVPIVLDKNGVIVAGHTRYKAANKLDLETVPCVVADDLTDEQIKAFRLADNKVSEFATWDFELLADELDGLDLDMSEFGFEKISPADFGDDFELPDGDEPEFHSVSFVLHTKQKELIEYALSQVKDDVAETYGNTNKNGNAIYEVVRQWAAQKK